MSEREREISIDCHLIGCRNSQETISSSWYLFRSTWRQSRSSSSFTSYNRYWWNSWTLIFHSFIFKKKLSFSFLFWQKEINLNTFFFFIYFHVLKIKNLKNIASDSARARTGIDWLSTREEKNSINFIFLIRLINCLCHTSMILIDIYMIFNGIYHFFLSFSLNQLSSRARGLLYF